MSLTRSSVVVSLLTAASLVAGVALNVATAYVFGASNAMDAYLAAITVPTYIITIITGMIGVTLIPAFVAAREQDSGKAWRLVSGLTNLATLASIVIVAGGVIGATWITRTTAPGFDDQLQASSAALLRVYFPVVVLTVVSELMSSVYYAHNEFVVPLLTKIITPLVSILFVLMLSHRMDAMSLVLAAVLGGILQCAVLGWGFVRHRNFKYRLRARMWGPDVSHLVRLMLPLGASMLLYKVVPVFDRYIMSELRPGSISSLGYATRLQLFAVQIISASISLAAFPVMAQLAARRDKAGLRETTSKIVRLLFFVSVPISVLSIVLGEPLLRLAFERGAFTREVAAQVYPCFVAYMVSLPIVVTGSVVSQGLYVMQDTRTVALLGVAETIVYVGLCFLLVDRLDILVVPVVYGIYFAASVLVTGWRFRSLLGLGGGRRLFSSCATHLAIGGVVGLLVLLVERQAPESKLLAAALFAAGGLIYFGIAQLLGVSEATLLWSKARSVIARR